MQHKFIEAVRMTSEADVTAVASKSMERAKAWAKKESLSSYYDSYEKLLSDPDIDVVYIATLSNAHYDNIKACLLAGKHVICEKPMTQTGAQAREVIDLAREKLISDGGNVVTFSAKVHTRSSVDPGRTHRRASSDAGKYRLESR